MEAGLDVDCTQSGSVFGRRFGISAGGLHGGAKRLVAFPTDHEYHREDLSRGQASNQAHVVFPKPGQRRAHPLRFVLQVQPSLEF